MGLAGDGQVIQTSRDFSQLVASASLAKNDNPQGIVETREAQG